MPVIIPSGYANVTLRYSGSAFPDGGAETSFGLAVIGSMDMASVASAVAAEWVDTMEPVTMFNAILDEVVAVDDTSLGTAPVNHAGNTTNTSAPPAVSALLRKQTALRGRAYRGRNYWPGLLPASAVDGSGGIDGTWRNTLQDAFDSFWLNLAGSAGELVLLHSTGSPATTPTVVTNAVVDGRVATQRGRNR